MPWDGRQGLPWVRPANHRTLAATQRRATLAPETVRWIRHWGRLGWPPATIARQLGVAPTTVRDILTGGSYRWVPDLATDPESVI